MTFLIIVITLVLIFDFINGFHDSANSIAKVVSTKVLLPVAVIALVTFLGDWRIVKTMGQRITKLKPFEGFCAETAGALTLFGATHFGIPVSTTHTITGSIIGVGAIKGVSSVKWGITKKIFWAWILTITVSALIGAAIFSLLHVII